MTIRVHTLSGSIHELDLEAMTYTRLRFAGGELRRDGEPLRLLDYSPYGVGMPMTLLLQVREDGMPTIRATNVITRIEEV